MTAGRRTQWSTAAVLLVSGALVVSGCAGGDSGKKANPSPSPVNDGYSRIVAGSGASVSYGRTGQLGGGFGSSCVGAVQASAMYLAVRDANIAHNEFDTLGEWKRALSGFLDDPDAPPGIEYDSADPPSVGLSGSYARWSKHFASPAERTQYRQKYYPMYDRAAPQDGVFRADSCTAGQQAEFTMATPYREDKFVGGKVAEQKATGNMWTVLALTLRWDGSTWRIEDVEMPDITDPNEATIGAYPATQAGRDAWRKTLGQTAVYQFANAGKAWGKTS